jgi:hypothetical protein
MTWFPDPDQPEISETSDPHMSIDLAVPVTLEERTEAVFGSNHDPMPLLEERAAEFLPQKSIVWECDAATFAFSYVSASAEAALGYPAERTEGFSRRGAEEVSSAPRVVRATAGSKTDRLVGVHSALILPARVAPRGSAGMVSRSQRAVARSRC